MKSLCLFTLSQLRDPGIKSPDLPDHCAIAPELLVPRLVTGDTSVALMTASYEPERQVKYIINEDFTPFRLRELM